MEILLPLFINLLPYCTPIRTDTQFINCMEYMVQCVQTDNEENCVEKMPEEYWPK